MTNIRINTEQVREVGQQFNAEADRLAEIGRELQGAINSLDTWAWDGRSRARATPLLNRVRPESERAAGGLDDLGRKLARVASVFDHEDATAARNLEGMPWVEWEVGGSLVFVGGPSLTDIDQGHVGDCYLIAAMGAIAYTQPDLIMKAIRKNDDGTYTVTFYDENGNPVEITVTDDFPTKDGKAFAQSTQEGELWVSLIEKAYLLNNWWVGQAADHEAPSASSSARASIRLAKGGI